MLVRGWVVAVTAIVGLSGCGVIKDLKSDMKDMKKSLDEVNRKGDHVAKRSDDIEREAKIKDSAAEFTKYMDRVFGENGTTNQSDETRKTNSDTEQIKDAEMAIRAMMFQFWLGDHNEASFESLDEVFAKAALMFFTRIRKYVDRNDEVDPKPTFSINPLEMIKSIIPDRGYKGVAALAARSDQIEDHYRRVLAIKGLPANLSFYEVIMEALRDRDLIRQGGLLPKAKTRILEWKREAIYFIQLRHNYLPMMALSRISDFEDMGLAERAGMLLTGKKMSLNDADPTKRISPALLIETTQWLNQALETRQRLRAIGIEPKYNRMCGTVLKRFDFDQAKILARQSPTSGDERRDQVVYAFAEAYQKVVSEMPMLELPSSVTSTIQALGMQGSGPLSARRTGGAPAPAPAPAPPAEADSLMMGP